MRWTGVTVALGCAMLAGCADYGRHGLVQPARYHAMACEGIDAERGRVEAATNTLFDKVRRHGVFAGRTDADVRDHWPMMIFLRDKAPRDRQRYEQLSLSYEQLRIAARQRGCTLTFASDVSMTVRPGAGMAAD